MKHVFGLGDLPLYVERHRRPAGGLVQLVLGREPGHLPADTVGTLYHLNAGVEPRGPEAHAEDFQQGLFSMPAYGGAASNQVQSFMFGYGPDARAFPTTSTRRSGSTTPSCGGARPTTGKGKIIFDDGTGRFMYIDGAKRYATGSGREWKKGEPKLFDPSNSISEFDVLPASDVVPDFPCKGCPSTKS